MRKKISIENEKRVGKGTTATKQDETKNLKK